MNRIEALKKLASLNEDGMTTLIFENDCQVHKYEVLTIKEAINEINGKQEEIGKKEYYVDEKHVRLNSNQGARVYWVVENMAYYNY